jgi:hypothetical protein
MIQEEEETTVNLEINLTSPSSPFLPLQMYQFKKQINVPITTKIEDTDMNTSMVGGSGIENNSNGIFGYFKSFFQGFSQNILQTKKHNHQNKKHLDKLFYSGNSEPVTTEPVTTEPVTTEPVTTEPVITEPVTTEPVITEPVITEPVITEPVITEPVITEPVTTELDITEPVTTELDINEASIETEKKDIEITKITLIADKIDLRESLKGTKIYFLEKRKDLPSHYV